MAIYSEHPSYTGKTRIIYDRISIDPDDQNKYSNVYRMNFDAKIEKNEIEEVTKLLKKLVLSEDTVQEQGIQEDEKSEYDEVARQLNELAEGPIVEKERKELPLDIPIQIISTEYIGIDAKFYIPLDKFSMEFYILQDLVLNDDEFAIMAVDEKARSGRRGILFIFT